MKKLFFGGLIGSLAFFIPACNNAEQDRRGPVDHDRLYFDYRIWGDEERGLITVTLQYRESDEMGDAVSLHPSANVFFDEEELDADSSRMNGVFYETSLPVENFTGKHAIVYTDPQGKKFKEEFRFRAMELNTVIPDRLPRRDLQLEFSGLDTSDFIHIIMTDTSFYGSGIDRIDTVRNGKLTISRDDLGKLHDGPVFLEFYREESWPLKETPGGAGRLNISYSLKRAFYLNPAGD